MKENVERCFYKKLNRRPQVRVARSSRAQCLCKHLSLGGNMWKLSQRTWP